ncbi:hypothetical protein Tco_0617399 [Tanacetum coccineum]
MPQRNVLLQKAVKLSYEDQALHDELGTQESLLKLLLADEKLVEAMQARNCFNSSLARGYGCFGSSSLHPNTWASVWARLGWAVEEQAPLVQGWIVGLGAAGCLVDWCGAWGDFFEGVVVGAVELACWCTGRC